MSDLKPEDNATDPIDDPIAKITKLEIDLANARKEAKTAKQEAAAAKRSAAAFEGIDLEEIAKLKEIETDRQQKELEAKGEYAKSLETFKAQAQQAEARATEAESRANKSLVDAALTMEFIKNGGNKDRLPLFLRTVDGIEVKEGKIAYPTVLNDSGSELENLGQYVAHLRETTLGIYFEPMNQSDGSGDKGGKVPPASYPRTVKPSEAGAYLEQIASGEIQVVD